MDLSEVDNVFAVVTLSDRNSQVNALGPFSVIHTFLPDLINQKVSNIVNISSLIAYIPSSRLSYYSSRSTILKFLQCIKGRSECDDELSSHGDEDISL